MTEFFASLTAIFIAFCIWYMSEDIYAYLYKAKVNVRLKRIELATGIRLYDWQKAFVLQEHQTYIYGGHRCGKTITAIFWTLMWRKEPIKVGIEQANLDQMRRYSKNCSLAIKDKDITSFDRLMWTLSEYEKYAKKCKRAWIKVAHVEKGDVSRNGKRKRR